eukprot:Protomagalhaensia_wolfi_Nauph_80__215@NODE_1117_length_1722_cov_20_647653_g851_i0_p1_GENE_NODE_1117_length_1722_cov_20_647653_g851_i0NODE_1117_length_1722_cov_20_647653_g851_i0_p1_ORF_typecomplete_len506_score97_92GDCP/PF02347_16/35GDCP/PF02347_16/3_9e07DpaA_N/PF16924_5/3e03DpaA_N/PF16924_5/1_3DpaA_N/PF16924_5/5e02_NODE_1117_length_1722_cov_20_647653_g851_i01391518
MPGLQLLALRLFQKGGDLAHKLRELGYSIQGEDSWLRTGEHFGVITVQKRSVKVLLPLLEAAGTNVRHDITADTVKIFVDESLLDEQVEEDRIIQPFRGGAKELSLFTCSSIPIALQPLSMRDPIIPTDPKLKGPMDGVKLRLWLHQLEQQDKHALTAIPGNPHTPLGIMSSTTLSNKSSHPRAPYDQQKGRLLLASIAESFLRGATGFDFVSLHPNNEIFALCDAFKAIRAVQKHSQIMGRRDLSLFLGNSPNSPVIIRALQMAGMDPFPVNSSLEGCLAHTTELLQKHTDRISSIILPFPDTQEGTEIFASLAATAKQMGVSVLVSGGDARPYVGTGKMATLNCDMVLLDLASILNLPGALFGEGLQFVAGLNKFVPFLPSPQWTSKFRVAFRKMNLTVPGGSPTELACYNLLPTTQLIYLWSTLLATGREDLCRTHLTVEPKRPHKSPSIIRVLSQ